MKIFQRGEKVNFVDINNVFVGYDTEQCCCENAGWFFSHTLQYKKAIGEDVGDLSAYVFDKDFFAEISNDDFYDMGGCVVFKLTAKGKPDLYLHIYNSHNGFYEHGFKFTDNEKIMRKGVL